HPATTQIYTLSLHDALPIFQEKAHQYTLDDRKALLDVIAELMASIGPRYRHLAQTGQVELAMSPWAHPIVPLLLDFRSAREAMPESEEHTSELQSRENLVCR